MTSKTPPVNTSPLEEPPQTKERSVRRGAAARSSAGEAEDCLSTTGSPPKEASRSLHNDTASSTPDALPPQTKERSAAAPPERFRYRLTFRKEHALRWIGHLDLQSTFERTLRRAKLPLWFSKGYHPRPKIVFASALPLGCSSEAELVDLWLREALAPDALLERLRHATPPGMTFTAAEAIPLSAPAVTTRVASARYRIAVPSGADAITSPDALQARLDALLAHETLPRRRRKRDYDLRPLIVSLRVIQDASVTDTTRGEDSSTEVATVGDTRRLTFEAELVSVEGATGRPEELLDALGFDATTCRVHRSALILREEEEAKEEPQEEEVEPQEEVDGEAPEDLNTPSSPPAPSHSTTSPPASEA